MDLGDVRVGVGGEVEVGWEGVGVGHGVFICLCLCLFIMCSFGIEVFGMNGELWAEGCEGSHGRLERLVVIYLFIH